MREDGLAISYRDDILHVDEVAVTDIAGRVGTPFYAYSATHMKLQFKRLEDALGEPGTAMRDRTLVCYAIKANSNQAVVTLFRNLGAGADLVTGGELERAETAGVDPQKIVFSGVGKTKKDILRAIQLRIRQINVESLDELRTINDVAGREGIKAHVAFRLNPQLDTLKRGDDSRITTGKPDSKFGIPKDVVKTTLDEMSRYPNIVVRGISIHIGSNFQNQEMRHLGTAFDLVLKEYLPLFLEKRSLGAFPDFDTIDLGGGVGIRYGDSGDVYHDPVGENELITEYGRILSEKFSPVLAMHPFLRLVLEPGRCLVGNAGILVTSVVNVKDELRDGKIPATFLVVDAAMNDLVRPGLYNSFHEIRPVRAANKESVWWDHTDICGTVCESTDSFCRLTEKVLHLNDVTLSVNDIYSNGVYCEQVPPHMSCETDGRPELKFGYFVRRRFPRQKEGDLVAIMSAGAYGAVMASEYNTRPLVPEVLVDGSRWDIIRRRPEVREIISRDLVPDWLLSN